MTDYSTGFVVAMDKYKLFATDRVFSEISYEMFTLDRSDLVHNYKFSVWKHSMQLRAMVDLCF